MPPLTCAVRGGVMQVNKRGHPQAILQHSVITFGSPHGRANSIPFNALIEGSRTGEERVVNMDDNKRQRNRDAEAITPATGTTTNSSATTSSADSADRKKLLQVNAELERTLEKLRQKTREEMKVRRKLSVARLKLEEEVDRRVLLGDGLLDLIRMERTFVQEQNSHFMKLLQKVILERDNAFQTIKQQKIQKESQDAMQIEINNLREENKALRQQFETLSASKTTLEESEKKLREENKRNESQFLNKIRTLESELMHTQAELQKVKKDLSDAQKTTEASEALIQQVRLFVQMVCQPNFYVVKDRSLQPVDKNRPDPTGFVLVPLTVLLQGYTLLSPSDRQNLIECYQAQL
ncbi:uncharacterized protein TM35_000023050 [Trypanosoma theileri]|uniref:Uncharacterized protein n=1 Tax=Trypanosoma theileri TaxID=67003 RepID=A0A1X0P8R8_9TRYP|nr:uncharacterized protein TM35_000023050 [Trypanosoma theileri]ORC92979.1 hypothetical protein TM35_000023050 [Trypanosoma theileri]